MLTRHTLRCRSPRVLCWNWSDSKSFSYGVCFSVLDMVSPFRECQDRRGTRRALDHTHFPPEPLALVKPP